MSHTPGPWIVDGLTIYKDATPTEPRKMVAFVCVDITHEERAGGLPIAGEHYDNARLICAAPELFDICRSIVESYDDMKIRMEYDPDRIRAIVAKVKGQTT